MQANVGSVYMRVAWAVLFLQVTGCASEIVLQIQKSYYVIQDTKALVKKALTSIRRRFLLNTACSAYGATNKRVAASCRRGT